MDSELEQTIDKFMDELGFKISAVERIDLKKIIEEDYHQKEDAYNTGHSEGYDEGIDQGYENGCEETKYKIKQNLEECLSDHKDTLNQELIDELLELTE